MGIRGLKSGTRRDPWEGGGYAGVLLWVSGGENWKRGVKEKSAPLCLMVEVMGMCWFEGGCWVMGCESTRVCARTYPDADG